MPRMPFLAFILALALALTSCLQSETGDEGGTTIKVLIAYSDSDTGRFPDYEGRIKALFAGTQAVFADSRTGVRLEIAKVAKVPFTPQERLADLQRLVRKKDGHLDILHALRDETQSDIVVLISPVPGATVNGSLLATEATAFVIVSWEDIGVPNHGLAHELGHLFGAMHPGDTSVVARQFPQGFPYADDSVRTVIAYGDQPILPYFSNPLVLHGGKALGVAGVSDIASVIRTTAPFISNFRGKITPTDFIPAGTVPTLDYSE